MRSPPFSPLVTTRSVSTMGPSETSRYSALFSGLTTSTNFLFWSVPIARSFTISAGSAFGWPMRSRANWPGMSRPSGLSKEARTRTVPLRASTWLSISCILPSNVSSPVASVMRTGMRSTWPIRLSSASVLSARVTTCSSALKLA